MREQAKFILKIIVIITYIVIPVIDSTEVPAISNGMSQLDGNDIPVSYLDVCCDAANKNVGFIS